MTHAILPGAWYRRVYPPSDREHPIRWRGDACFDGWVLYLNIGPLQHTQSYSARIYALADGCAGKGETALEYVGCGAPCNSGYHRYIWLLFKQTGQVSVEATQKFFEVGFCWLRLYTYQHI